MRKFFLVCLIFLTGCQADTVQNRMGQLNHSSGEIQDGQADHIAEQVQTIEAIEYAVVTISNNAALVSINLKQSVSKQELENIRQEIIKTVQQTDTSIQKVVVSFAPEMMDHVPGIDEGNETMADISPFPDILPLD